MDKIFLSLVLVFMTVPGSFGISTIYSFISSIFFVVCITYMLFSHRKQLVVNKFILLSIIIYVFQIILLCFLTLLGVNDYTQSIKYIFTGLSVMILLYSIYYMFSRELFLNILEKMIYIMAFIAIACFTLFNNQIDLIINENQLTLMIYPAFILLLFSQRYGLLVKVIIYIIGVCLLFITGGRTTAAIFLLTPLFLLFSSKTHLIKHYLVSIILMFFLFVYFLDPSTLFYININNALSDRLDIYNYYLNYEYNGILNFLFGTGLTEGQVYSWRTINAHNTWVNYLFFQGLFGVIINLGLLLYAFSNISKLYFKYVCLILGILTIQLFETVFLFSFGYINFIMSFLIIALCKAQVSESSSVANFSKY